jgi:hypothetical protein
MGGLKELEIIKPALKRINSGIYDNSYKNEL